MKLLLTILFLITMSLLGWQLVELFAVRLAAPGSDGTGIPVFFLILATGFAVTLTVNNYIHNVKE